MEEPRESGHIVKASPKYPIPPKVSYGDYLKILSKNEKIGRWRMENDKLADWFKFPENRRLLRNCYGRQISILDFFQETPYPVIEGTALRCRYSAPAQGSNLEDVLPIFDLYCDNVTSKEIEAVNNVPVESKTGYMARLLKWQQNLKELQEVKKLHSRILHKWVVVDGKTIPQDATHHKFAQHHENAHNKRIFSFFYFDTKTRELKTTYEPINEKLFAEYEASLGTLKKQTPPDLKEKDLSSKHLENIHFCFDGDRQYREETLTIRDSLFDINGNYFLESLKTQFTRGYFLTVGNLIFKPYDKTSPIQQIILTACDSTMPMIITGTVNFRKYPNTDLGFIGLECINVSRIDLQFNDEEHIEVPKLLPKPKEPEKAKDPAKLKKDPLPSKT